jgi:hexosaminidase
MLVPLPAHLAWGEGVLRLAPGIAVSWSVPGRVATGESLPAHASAVDATRTEAAQSMAHDLAVALGERTGFPVTVRDDGVIRLVLESGGVLKAGAFGIDSAAAAAGSPGSAAPPDLPALESEAYHLEITPRGARLAATAPVGLFRGLHTLLQLVPESGAETGAGVLSSDRNIRAVDIIDRPRFRWRGLHLDVARHFFPADRVKDAIDWCAWHKLNVLHWHLVDDQGWRFPVARFPRLTEIGAWRCEAGGERYGGAYTAGEITEVVDYAARRFVTVVPEIEMPGHARAALAAHPELSCRGLPLRVPADWGVFEDVFCAGKEETFAFLGAVLDEVAMLFPGPFVHIGGDECPKERWKACPDCRRRMEAEGLPDTDALQAWFVRRTARHLVGLGKRLVGWDEILDGAGSVPGSELPKDAVVMSWRGFAGGIRAARAGHEVVMTPTEHCYLDHYQGPREAEPPAFPADLPLERAYAFEPTPPDLDPESAARILGGQGNTWTERMPDWGHLQYMVFPRLCALAEALWSPRETRDEADFKARLEIHARRLRRLGIRLGRIG